MKVTKKMLYQGIAVFCALFIAAGTILALKAHKNKTAATEAYSYDSMAEPTSQNETDTMDNSDTDDSLSEEVLADSSNPESTDSSATETTDIVSNVAQSNRSGQAGSQNTATSGNSTSTQSSGNATSNNSGSNTSTQSSQTTTRPVTGTTPQTTPQTQAPYVSDSSLSEKEQVLSLTNQIRQEVGASNLTLDPALSALADIRAKEIVESFAHTRPDGSQFYSVMNENGYSYSACGENIAYGYSTPSSVVTGWKNSAGHYKNMVSTSFGRLGVGVYVQNGTYYWVQLFAN